MAGRSNSGSRSWARTSPRTRRLRTPPCGTSRRWGSRSGRTRSWRGSGAPCGPAGWRSGGWAPRWSSTGPPTRRGGRRPPRPCGGCARRGRPLRISRARKVELVLSGLGRRYLGEHAMAGETTALAKITAETEDPFKVLIGTILSQRTRDEMTEVASRRLFARYGTPQALARADVRDVQRRIKPVGFYRQKARKVREVSRILIDRHGGRVPTTYEQLIELPQVGPKTANCVLVYGYGLQALPIDTHCHRIPNRLGLVRTKTPEETERALARIVPREYWLNVNEWFIRFGKEVCKPIGPRCSECRFTSFCAYYRREGARLGSMRSRTGA